MEHTAEFKTYCLSVGADHVGIAPVTPLKAGLTLLPADLLDPYSSIVAIVKRLDDVIVDEITDRPTPRYAQHYRDINAQLDVIAAQVAQRLKECGYRAVAIPASKVEDEKNLLGAISHKAVARMAGIGWQGKSLLIVNPDFGPRFRLATILTDSPLLFDSPVRNRCGSCTACTYACPVGAIKNVSTDMHYRTCDEAVDMAKCTARCFSFKSQPDIAASVCGVCVRACPFGIRSRAIKS